MYTWGHGIGVRPFLWLPGTFVLDVKSAIPACFYHHFWLRGLSRPKIRKVDQSSLGAGQGTWGAIPVKTRILDILNGCVAN